MINKTNITDAKEMLKKALKEKEIALVLIPDGNSFIVHKYPACLFRPIAYTPESNNSQITVK